MTRRCSPRLAVAYCSMLCFVASASSVAAQCEPLEWYGEIYSDNRAYVKVAIDVRKMQKLQYLQDISFQFAFYGPQDRFVSTDALDFADEPTMGLDPAFYVIYLKHPHSSASSAKGVNMIFTCKTRGQTFKTQQSTVPSKNTGWDGFLEVKETTVIGTQPTKAEGASAGGGRGTPATTPLTLFWHPTREDNVTVAAPESIRAQELTRGYQRVRVEGCILMQPAPGTRPLILFWHPKREDNATVADPESIRAQQVTGGYQQVRIEGHVFENQQDGTVPLILFWHPKREDNATVADPRSIRAQQVTGGYRQVRIEGYIYEPGRCAP